jgi:hypothetical protein
VTCRDSRWNQPARGVKGKKEKRQWEESAFVCLTVYCRDQVPKVAPWLCHLSSPRQCLDPTSGVWNMPAEVTYTKDLESGAQGLYT